MTWRYTDATKRVAVRTNDDSSCQSCLVSVLPLGTKISDELIVDRQKQNAINRVQACMDAKAQEYGYDHILSASSYVTSTFPKFKAEGIAFAKWRDDVWLHCYFVLAEWEAGTSKITTEDELIASLPEFIVEY